MNKPHKPNVQIPSAFALNGQKTDFTETKIQNGFNPIDPDVLAGDNLNKFIDDTYKSINYTNAGVEDLYKSLITYDPNETYNLDSLVFFIDDNNKISLYKSKSDDNIKPLSDTNYWEKVELGGGGRNVGEIIQSTLPLTDAGLHLLDGTLIDGSGIYAEFADYIAELYSETPTDWTQPVLTSNGTMGGSNFAVRSNVVQLSGNDVWHAFDGITSGGNYFHSQSGTKTGYIDIFNPVPIKITNFKIYNQNGSANRASSSGIIYGSNDGTSWTQLKTYTNSVQTAGGTWNIDLSANENYYRYYRMESTAGGSDSYWVINEIQITAKYKKLPNYFCTESEWQASVTQYGSCGKFVYDSTNNTVRLPKVSNILQGTTDLTALGSLIEAGLPIHTHTRGDMNITGYLWTRGLEDIGGTGAFYGSVSSYGWNRGHEQDTRATDINFSADRSWTGSTSNPNYTNTNIQNSNTVQPQTIKTLLYIVIATSSKTDIQVDIDEIATDLNGKADNDLTNVTDTGYIKMAGAGMPSNKYIDLTLGASGTTYTAPANGWYNINKGAGNPGFNPYIALINITAGGLSTEVRPGSQGVITIQLFLPAKKGDVIRVDYDATGNTNRFRFIYAQGSASEVN